MPDQGDIICVNDFEFEDGSKRDKLFVVLNVVDGKTPCLVLKTTSQSARYPGVTQGCNAGKKAFFVPSSWEPCFKVDTYIQMPQIFEFSAPELIKGGLNKQIIVINSLSLNCLAQLKNCLKKFKEDISEHHWQIILESN